MNILLISAGLLPKRSGGVPLYVAHLRNELIQRGHQVTYLDTNCHDISRTPRIVPTSANPPEFAFFNSGSQPPWGKSPLPLSDIHASPQSRACFLAFVAALQPDIVHFQELLSIPMEMVSLLRAQNHKLLFTAHDYFSICPTIQLFKHDQQLCTLPAAQLECHRCVSQWPVSRFPSSADWALKLVRRPGLPARLLRLSLRALAWAPIKLLVARDFRNAVYRDRRIQAVALLGSFNLILCVSQRQHALLSAALGNPQNCRQLYPSSTSYAQIQPAPPPPPIAAPQAAVVRFAALNVNQPVKGRALLLAEFQALRHEVPNVELHLFGEAADPHLPGVIAHGPYQLSQLDQLLRPMDAGVIPSLWAESYGSIGPEMLTRGLPLTVSTTGAMPEYVTPRLNGLLFDPAVPGQLKQAMQSLATNPALLQTLKANAPLSTRGIVRFPAHVTQIESIYAEILNRAK